MKKLILFLFLAPLFALGYDTVSDCDKAIKSLTVERSRLRNLDRVAYAEKDDRRHNVVSRMGVFFVNRRFVVDPHCSFVKWQEWQNKVFEYDKVQARIAAIDKEIEDIKRDRVQLLDKKRTRRKSK